VIKSGQKAGIWVSTCGEMAADPAVAILLIGLGIDEISTSPLILPKVKKAIRSVTLKQAKEIAQEAMKFVSGEEIKKFINERLKQIIPELIEN